MEDEGANDVDPSLAASRSGRLDRLLVGPATLAVVPAATSCTPSASRPLPAPRSRPSSASLRRHFVPVSSSGRPLALLPGPTTSNRRLQASAHHLSEHLRPALKFLAPDCELVDGVLDLGKRLGCHLLLLGELGDQREERIELCNSGERKGARGVVSDEPCEVDKLREVSHRPAFIVRTNAAAAMASSCIPFAMAAGRKRSSGRLSSKAAQIERAQIKQES